MNNFLQKAKGILSRISSKLSKVNFNFSIFKKNEIKYIFYTISMFLPLLIILLFKELKGYNILILSYTAFISYINLCIFQKICVLPQSKGKCEPKVDRKDLVESLFIGLLSFLSLFAINRFYHLFMGLFRKSK